MVRLRIRYYAHTFIYLCVCACINLCMIVLAHVCGSSVVYPAVFFGQVLELSDFFLTIVNREGPDSTTQCFPATFLLSTVEGKNGYAKHI